MKNQGDGKVAALLDLPAPMQAAFVAGARDQSPVRGLTHGFYKYPARFSPVFARTVIKTFTLPGDVVLDNHVGGGTTLVEALSLGRHAIGVDLSTLAAFIAQVKTTILADAELSELEAWIEELSETVHVHRSSAPLTEFAKLGYYRHLNDASRWRLRKAIEQAIACAVDLRADRLVAFGRCVVLRTAQWALDGRRTLPSVPEFRERLVLTAKEMLRGARSLRRAVGRYTTRPKAKVLNRSSAGLEQDKRVAKFAAPKLVLTSPPYPGMHVLYHRWQVDGRKEAPLPFMIANKLDGAGGSYYTMGDRKFPELRTYFESVEATMKSAAALADADTVFVQMVAFSEPRWQLPRYLQAMNAGGLEEVRLSILDGKGDGRLWRSVPGRRWYNDLRDETPGSQEVVLLHRRLAVTQSQIRGHRQVRHRISPQAPMPLGRA